MALNAQTKLNNPGWDNNMRYYSSGGGGMQSPQGGNNMRQSADINFLPPWMQQIIKGTQTATQQGLGGNNPEATQDQTPDQGFHLPYLPRPPQSPDLPYVNTLGNYGLKHYINAVKSPGWSPQGRNMFQLLQNQKTQNMDDLAKQTNVAYGTSLANMARTGLDAGEFERANRNTRNAQVMGQQGIARQHSDNMLQAGIADMQRKDALAGGLAQIDDKIRGQNEIRKEQNIWNQYQNQLNNYWMQILNQIRGLYPTGGQVDNQVTQTQPQDELPQ